MPKVEDEITRREAIKGLGLGVGVITALPVLTRYASAQEMAGHDHMTRAAQSPADQKPEPLRFFTPEENRSVTELTERIIPADESSPGAKAARVSEYIDLVLSESPEITQQTWRQGLGAIDKMSKDKFGAMFADAKEDQQVELLKSISQNEKSPTTTEEKFFRTLKYATIDGYYSSEIGIHKELHYKGNTYLKEFTGCTHPEHQQ
jgi:hypothetical protein